MDMKKAMPGYQSYLLRLWLVKDNDKMNWRASLESPQSGAHYNFATLKDLFDFLHQQTSALIETSAPEQAQ